MTSIALPSARLAPCLILCAVLALVTPPAADAAECNAEGYRWTLRAFGAKVAAKGDTHLTETSDPFERTKFHLDSGAGAGAEAEYRPTCRVGVALGALTGSLDSMFVYDSDTEWLMASDDVDFDLLTLGVNFHLTPRSRADLFVGPFLGFMDYSALEFEGFDNQFDRQLDSDTTVGINLGLDVPFKEDGPWAFTAGVRYLPTSAEGNGVEFDVDPLVATAGLAYRWNGGKCGPCEAEVDAPVIVEPEPAPEPEPEPEVAPQAEPEPVVAAPAPAVEPEPAPVEEREVCHFTSNSARVSNICKAKLDEVALKLKQDPELGARVLGHADSTGDDRINDPLSLRRADAVKVYLVERHAIDPNRVSTEGRGSREPIAPNDTADGRAENRRAVVIIAIG